MARKSRLRLLRGSSYIAPPALCDLRASAARFLFPNQKLQNRTSTPRSTKIGDIRHRIALRNNDASAARLIRMVSRSHHRLGYAGLFDIGIAHSRSASDCVPSSITAPGALCGSARASKDDRRVTWPRENRRQAVFPSAPVSNSRRVVHQLERDPEALSVAAHAARKPRHCR
jgi:hypothetical protein